MNYKRAEIGRRIKEAITNSKISQKQLAAEIGVKPPSVTAYIQGSCNVPVEALEAAARMCGVSIDWIVTGRNSEDNSRISEEQLDYNAHSLSPEEEKFLKILDERPDVRAAMEAFIALPERKQRIHLGKMSEDLDKLEDDSKGR